MAQKTTLPFEPISPSALLGLAEIYFKYALNLSNTIKTSKVKIEPFKNLSLNKQRTTNWEFKQTKEHKFLGHGYLEECAIYLCTLQIDKAFEETIPDRFNHQDTNIVTASLIARTMRNSFAHNPFNPIWLVDRKQKGKLLEIKNVIRLDLKVIDGLALRSHHYGGPSAVLRFLKYSKKLVRKFEATSGRKFFIK